MVMAMAMAMSAKAAGNSLGAFFARLDALDAQLDATFPLPSDSSINTGRKETRVDHEERGREQVEKGDEIHPISKRPGWEPTPSIPVPAHLSVKSAPSPSLGDPVSSTSTSSEIHLRRSSIIPPSSEYAAQDVQRSQSTPPQAAQQASASRCQSAPPSSLFLPDDSWPLVRAGVEASRTAGGCTAPAPTPAQATNTSLGSLMMGYRQYPSRTSTAPEPATSEETKQKAGPSTRPSPKHRAKTIPPSSPPRRRTSPASLIPFSQLADITDPSMSMSMSMSLSHSRSDSPAEVARPGRGQIAANPRSRTQRCLQTEIHEKTTCDVKHHRVRAHIAPVPRPTFSDLTAVTTPAASVAPVQAAPHLSNEQAEPGTSSDTDEEAPTTSTAAAATAGSPPTATRKNRDNRTRPQDDPFAVAASDSDATDEEGEEEEVPSHAVHAIAPRVPQGRAKTVGSRLKRALEFDGPPPDIEANVHAPAPRKRRAASTTRARNGVELVTAGMTGVGATSLGGRAIPARDQGTTAGTTVGREKGVNLGKGKKSVSFAGAAAPLPAPVPGKPKKYTSVMDCVANHAAWIEAGKINIQRARLFDGMCILFAQKWDKTVQRWIERVTSQAAVPAASYTSDLARITHIATDLRPEACARQLGLQDLGDVPRRIVVVKMQWLSDCLRDEKLHVQPGTRVPLDKYLLC